MTFILLITVYSRRQMLKRKSSKYVVSTDSAKALTPEGTAVSVGTAITQFVLDICLDKMIRCDWVYYSPLYPRVHMFFQLRQTQHI